MTHIKQKDRNILKR